MMTGTALEKRKTFMVTEIFLLIVILVWRLPFIRGTFLALRLALRV